MTSDHLIERAAARLRSGVVPSVPDRDIEAATSILPVPPPARLSHTSAPPMPARPTSPTAEPALDLAHLVRAGLVVGEPTRTRISEEYRISVGRILRASADSTDRSRAQNLIMVTSARPGEGKSFTALNLAASIAHHGPERVILVDIDSKPRSLSFDLGLSERQGFLDLITDATLKPEATLVSTALPGLSVLPAGLQRTASTLQSGARRITPMLDRLARLFPRHLLILDAPPCLSMSDPSTIAPHVGQIVMVVEAERTQRNEVESALDLIKVCPTITVLLNKIKLTTSSTFGAYDY